jgi:limonene 1,2-monooxygenase
VAAIASPTGPRVAAKPRFQGSAGRLQKASDYAVTRWEELDKRHGDAIQAATDRHAKERADAGKA